MDYRKEYEKWLASPALSEDERAELRALEGNDKEIKARFYGPLEFGTAGLRGTMYTGLHNMNRHVIRWATQGFANVIRAEGTEAMQKGIAVCMDCRNHSAEFARETACVMAANGIHVRLFESLRPTPELSFAVREYGCQAGVNVTASHNPKEYNGYKVYWADGAQLPPQHAAAIADELTRIDIFTGVRSMDYEQALAEGRIELLGEDCDRRFMANVMGMVNDYETVKKVADDFGLVYTPFHGCGYKLVPEALTRLGIKHLYCEPKQMVIDGDFPTVVSPNPENPEGFYLAIDLAREKNVDFILGTDPDSDRVGIMVRNKSGEFEPVTGNQTGVLLLDYLIGAMKRAGKLPAHPAALKTIVTTEMARAVAEAIHAAVGGDIVELQPVTPYPEAYRATTDQAKQELASGYKPPLKNRIGHIEAYDVVFVGSPNWWGTVAGPVRTFLSEYDLAGKRIAPFITHEGSALGRSVADIKTFCPKAVVLDGLAVRGSRAASAQGEVAAWLRKIGMGK